MAIKNKYYYRSKISERKFRELVRYFSLDFTASDTARLTGLSVRSVNTIFLKMRQRIAENCEQQSPVEGIVEVDESYFGARRIRGKRGRGASGKTIVFGIFKHVRIENIKLHFHAAGLEKSFGQGGNDPQSLFPFNSIFVKPEV